MDKAALDRIEKLMDEADKRQMQMERDLLDMEEGDAATMVTRKDKNQIWNCLVDSRI